MAVLESILAVGLATVGGAEVRLEATKLSYRVDEAVVVRVLVQNPRESAVPLFVEPSFWVLPGALPEQGQTTLLIDVVGPDGLWIPPQHQKDPTIVAREKIEPCSFVRLLPGQSLGQEVVINESGRGVPMARVGTYRVSVTVEGHGRRWLDGWRKKRPPSESLPFTSDQLFDGSVRVGPIELHVVE